MSSFYTVINLVINKFLKVLSFKILWTLNILNFSVIVSKYLVKDIIVFEYFYKLNIMI